ncbi:MAG: hypothetical protein ACLPYZ_15990 [Limisphaerales bacterium]
MNSNTAKTKSVVDEARFVAASNWTGPADESTADKESTTVTRLWQERLEKTDAERFKKEVSIAGKMNEKIDLVDFKEKVAYELKVSGNNPGHEFYKDLFKVLIYNQNHNQIKLNTLVFITQGKGVDKLEKGLGKVSADFIRRFGVNVELARLD